MSAGKTVFLKNGFGQANMDDVASLARVSKMTVYRHFRSKEQLFAAVVTDLCSRMVSNDLADTLQKEPNKALQAFAQQMITTLYAHDTVELHRIVVAEGKRFPELGVHFYKSGPNACIRTLESYFEKNRRDARFRVTNPRAAAEEFLDLLRGYPHLRALLGMVRKPSEREMSHRIASAIRLVLK